MHYASNQKCSKIVWAAMTNLVLSLKMTVIILYELTNHHHHGSVLFEGSLEVKLPTICTDEKAEVGRAERRREEERSEKRKNGKKEDAGARKR